MKFYKINQLKNYYYLKKKKSNFCSSISKEKEKKKIEINHPVKIAEAYFQFLSF